MTISDALAKLPRPLAHVLPTPEYHPVSGSRIALAVSSMKDHTTNEGWEIMLGLQSAGYTLCGKGCEVDETDVNKIVDRLKPSIVMVNDKREWDVQPRCFRDRAARFHHVDRLAREPGIFKLTILKDAHQNPGYHRQSAEEIGCHAWIVYYHPRIVSHLAPYVRPEHLIRTWHSVDTALVPKFSTDRKGAVLSGAISGVYPLRKRLAEARLPQTDVIKHPGYHRAGCATPEFLKTLSRYKVAICTASIYGYALRKIIEATACGCVVITDLPSDEIVPEIDANLVRIDPDIGLRRMSRLIEELCESYNPERQKQCTQAAQAYFDWHAVGSRLARDIEIMRASYADAV